MNVNTSESDQLTSCWQQRMTHMQTASCGTDIGSWVFFVFKPVLDLTKSL